MNEKWRKSYALSLKVNFYVKQVSNSWSEIIDLDLKLMYRQFSWEQSILEILKSQRIIVYYNYVFQKDSKLCLLFQLFWK